MASAAKQQISEILNRLVLNGPAALSDAELVAILLRDSLKGSHLVDVATTMLREAGSLFQLLRSAQDGTFAGATPGQNATLSVSLELAKRHYEQTMLNAEALESPAASKRFLIAALRDKPYEVFCCLYLDNRHRVIAFEELFQGDIDGASVHPRVVVHHALNRRAAAVIFAHQHPSGIAEPSQADELITSRLKDALALLSIRVLDHFVIGGSTCISFAERGLL